MIYFPFLCWLNCIFIVGQQVISLGTESQTEQCNREEADTIIVVYIAHAIQQGSASSIVPTVDTDVLVVLIGKFLDLQQRKQNLDLWVFFGVGKNLSNYSINALCASLGEMKSRGLPFFTALQAETQLLHFREKANSLPGRLDKHIPRLPPHSQNCSYTRSSNSIKIHLSS